MEVFRVSAPDYVGYTLQPFEIGFVTLIMSGILVFPDKNTQAECRWIGLPANNGQWPTSISPTANQGH